jgi:hypothetical protein
VNAVVASITGACLQRRQFRKEQEKENEDMDEEGTTPTLCVIVWIGCWCVECEAIIARRMTMTALDARPRAHTCVNLTTPSQGLAELEAENGKEDDMLTARRDNEDDDDDDY